MDETDTQQQPMTNAVTIVMDTAQAADFGSNFWVGFTLGAAIMCGKVMLRYLREVAGDR